MLTPGYLLAVNEYGQLDSQNPGELTLKGYQIATNANPITTEDTISQAFGKVEYKINVLNADASTEGSVAHAIAEIVEVDGGAIDKLKEISNWITDEDAGAAKIISDVATNAGDIVLNKTAIENLESLIDADKVAVWNKAEENVQADWAETSETADSFIKNKPDLSEMIKTSTTFDYIYNETTTAMTISALMEKIAELEARIAILENPVSPEPEPEPEIPEEEPAE